MSGGELKSQNNQSKEQGGAHKESNSNAALVSLVEQKILNQLGFTPGDEDVAFWPIFVLNRVESIIAYRERYGRYVPGGIDKAFAPIAEIAAPIKESLRKVYTAYEILAYPRCGSDRQRFIVADLMRDQKLFDRNSVELNDTELGMLSKIAATRGVRSNPQKRIYIYSEVPSVS